MKRLNCTACGSRVYFENATCLQCGHSVGFDADTLSIVALEPVAEGGGRYRRFESKGKEAAVEVRLCDNAVYGACNWLIPDNDPATLCKSCARNRTIPNLSEAGRLDAWREVEHAKKRLTYSLLRFGLPLEGGGAADIPPLMFDVVAQALTGHANGLITLDVLEADSVERERRRRMFAEPYRSLLGHLRHEIGHYYWMLLVNREGVIDAFRALFGDEQQDYQTALSNYYANGAPPDWSDRYVSAYASSHPWEDWAETWAHYLHMVDAVETAEAEGMEPRAAGLRFGAAWPFKKYDVYRQEGFDSLMNRWVPLSIALNNLSRSLGHGDLYPFVISSATRDKLAFVHRLIRGR